ncbi:rib-1 [Symbiodinium natans]|uniref:Rib-1 protein n=1 Tax=Symbiodinium natans TaxID=878477 RepID=A0A812Q6I3_9DINO|nr:rib-1 [Symbiodinium natans]
MLETPEEMRVELAYEKMMENVTKVDEQSKICLLGLVCMQYYFAHMLLFEVGSVEAAAEAFRMMDEHSGALHPDLFDKAAGYGKTWPITADLMDSMRRALLRASVGGGHGGPNRRRRFKSAFGLHDEDWAKVWGAWRPGGAGPQPGSRLEEPFGAAMTGAPRPSFRVFVYDPDTIPGLRTLTRGGSFCKHNQWGMEVALHDWFLACALAQQSTRVVVVEQGSGSFQQRCLQAGRGCRVRRVVWQHPSTNSALTSTSPGGKRPAISRRVRERRKVSRNPTSHGTNPMVLTSKLRNSTSPAELLSLLEKEVDAAVFNDFHMSATFTRLAFFKRSRRLSAIDARSPVWPRLTARLQVMLKTDMISPRAVANVLWALVEIYQDINMHVASAVPALVRCVRNKAADMNEFDLSNSLWAVASLHESEPEVLMAVPVIAERIPQKAASMVPQALSNCLWAAEYLRDAAPAVLTAVPAIAECILQKVKDFDPQGVSNILWASANLQEAAPAVLVAVPVIAEVVPHKVESMKPQEIANSFWAVANLQKAAPAVLMAVPSIAERIPQKAESMNPQELSNSLLAAAKLQEVAPTALTAVLAIAERIPEKADGMIPQHLSNIIWAAAKLQKTAPAVLMAVPAIVKRIPQKVESMIPQHLSNILWAAANLQEAVPAVLTAVPAIAESIPQKEESMIPLQLSNILWAAANLQEAAPAVLTVVPAIVERISQKVESFNPQDLSNILWAIAKLEDAAPCALSAVPPIIAQASQEITSMNIQGLRMSSWAANQLGEEDLEAKLKAELARRKGRRREEESMEASRVGCGRSGCAHEADFFFVPHYTSCLINHADTFKGCDTKQLCEPTTRLFEEVLSTSTSYLQMEGGQNHLFVWGSGMGADGPFATWRKWVPNAIFMMTETELWNPYKDVVEPSFTRYKDILVPGRLTVDDMIALGKMARPLDERDKLGHFIGWPRPPHPSVLPPETCQDSSCSLNVRSVLLALKETEPLFHVDVDVPYVESFLGLTSSLFCFVPRGKSAWSSRFFQTFFAGCIPVLLNDRYEPPFGEFVDLPSAVIKWPMTQVGG